MDTEIRFNVHVQQPTVPHYRIPFFDSLAARYERGLVVSASRRVVDGPPSADIARQYLDLNHSCTPLLGRRAYWQKNMLPHQHMVPGDVAVICGNPRYLSTYRYVLAARRRGIGIVWWGHGWSPTSKQWAINLRSTLMRAVDSILLYSDAEISEWRDRLPTDIEIVGAQNAIDQSRTVEQRSVWSGARLEKFQRDNELIGRKIILFCGRLRTRPHTGVDLLLQSLVELKQLNPSYLIVIIGDGEDGERLKHMAQQLGVASHVLWLGSQFEESIIAPWFLSASCFAYPGPIGLSILHAMGYGLPVVTHADRRRHNPEIVTLRDGWNGLMFKDGDATSLTQQIHRITSDSGLRGHLSNNALQTAHRDYTLHTMANRFAQAVEFARQRTTARQN